MRASSPSATWDVIVVGAGPAGASAARLAAEEGARVLLLDKAQFPRYKTCGGGITGTSRRYLPPGLEATFERTIASVQVSHKMADSRLRRAKSPLLGMVERDVFDQANVDAAIAAGSVFRDGANVKAIEELDGLVRVSVGEEQLTARVVVGADGAGGRVGRYVGVEIEQTDLGLEAEIRVPNIEDWDTKFLLDWGVRKGTYAWVFPKTDTLTVGVIEEKGHPEETRIYLEEWIEHLDLTKSEVVRKGGHLTQWRVVGSPVRRGRVVIAGETAGLLEPWTREGISFALRSGTWAGKAAARFSRGEERALSDYERQVRRNLEPEVAAGREMRRAFERRPGVTHFLTGHDFLGTKFFFAFCRGQITLAGTLRVPGVRHLIAAIAR